MTENDFLLLVRGPLLTGATIIFLLGVVLRLLEKNRSAASFDLEGLGFPQRIITDIREVLRQPNGLVLVTEIEKQLSMRW